VSASSSRVSGLRTRIGFPVMMLSARFSHWSTLKTVAGRAFYLFRGSLAQHRSEYVIPQRCADTVVSRRELVMTSVVLKQ